MKRRITQGDIARLIAIDQGSVSRILNKDTRDSFSEETIKRVFKAAREVGYLHPSLVSTNRRQSHRKQVEMKAKLSIIVGTNTVFDRGEVDLHELSMSGCLLRAFKTEKGVLPLDRFRFDIEVADPKLKGFRGRCRVIRFSDREDEFALAVAFDQLSPDAQEKLRDFLR
jgi:hypothetical protein